MKDERLTEMRAFMAVATLGGFTAAASLLESSQSFISSTVSSLERRLGVQLLHRSTRGQRLTAEGERFLASCKHIMQELDDAEADIRSDEPRGDLRASIPLAFGTDQIVPQLTSFLSANPNVSLHLSLTDEPVNLMKDNFDVAVRMGHPQDSSLVSRRLCTIKRLVVASPGYVAERGFPATPAELAQHQCLVWEAPMERLNRWPFFLDGGREEVTVRGNLHASSGTALYKFCIAGIGIMRLAEYLAIPAIQRGELVPLLTEFQAIEETPVYAVFHREHKLVPRIRAFVDHLVSAFEVPPWRQAHNLSDDG